MLGHSSGNHDWLLANTSACFSCGFHLRNASDCVWMETGLNANYEENESYVPSGTADYVTGPTQPVTIRKIHKSSSLKP